MCLMKRRCWTKTCAAAIVVSEPSIVRVFHDGELIAEIIPELWLPGRQVPTMRGGVTDRHAGNMTIFTSNDTPE